VSAADQAIRACRSVASRERPGSSPRPDTGTPARRYRRKETGITARLAPVGAHYCGRSGVIFFRSREARSCSALAAIAASRPGSPRASCRNLRMMSRAKAAAGTRRRYAWASSSSVAAAASRILSCRLTTRVSPLHSRHFVANYSVAV